jgi:ketosteroid isomerase-like protein
MTMPPAAPTRETTIREAYAALNRGDVAGFVANFDPEVLRTEPADPPEAGVFRGLEAVTAHVAFHRANWAEGGCEPERFVTAGDRTIALVHVRVRLKNETEWREGDAADCFVFRNGKATEFHTFFDVQKGLEWAGVAAESEE